MCTRETSQSMTDALNKIVNNASSQDYPHINHMPLTNAGTNYSIHINSIRNCPKLSALSLLLLSAVKKHIVTTQLLNIQAEEMDRRNPSVLADITQYTGNVNMPFQLVIPRISTW